MARNGDRKLEVTILGDSASVERAMARTDAAAEKTTIKVAGFEKAFRSAGVAAGVAGELTSRGFGLLEDAARAAGDAIIGYNKEIQSAESRIRGFTGSQAKVADALALARAEADAGRGTYTALLSSIADLTPLARTSNVAMADLLHTAQLLAAADPVQGLEGAQIALREALSGDFTSLTRRFEIPRAAIQKMKDEGVPNIEIVRRSLANLGIDEKLLAEQAKTAETQQAILLDTLKQIGAEGGKPVFDVFLKSLLQFNAALKTPASKGFVSQLAEELQIILSGNFFADLALQGVKAFYLIANSYNDFLRAVSGGKIEVNKDILASFRKAITDQEGAIRADVAKTFTAPVAAALSGSDGGALAPSTVAGYGQAVLRAYLAGLTPTQASALDQITGAITKGLDKGSAEAANAASLIVVALKEIDQQGQISETTLYRLTSQYGAQAAEVQKLLDAYRAMSAAEAAVVAAQSRHAAAQAAVNAATAAGESVLAGYQAQLADATREIEQHAAAHDGLVSSLQGEIATVQRSAQATAQAYQDQTAALQEQAQAAQEAAAEHAAASAAAVNAAESEVAALQAAAALHRGLLDAVLKGETAEYLAQQDAVDELTRKTAERWEAEIGGARRARDGANKQIKDLTRAGNREDLDYIRRINAARAAGNEREARRLEREKAAADKKRAGALETARAEAAVANDNFDAAQEQVEKEAKALEAKDDAATKVATKRLGEVRDQAEAQAKADAAAVKGIQDAITEISKRAAASARASADRVREIQDEIDRENTRYRVIKAGDDAAAAALQALITQRRSYWQQETTQLGNIAIMYDNDAKRAKEIAAAAKDTYEYLVKIYDLYKDNPPGSPTGPPLPPTPTPPNVTDRGREPSGAPTPSVPGGGPGVLEGLRRTPSGDTATSAGLHIEKMEITYIASGESGSAADLAAFGRAAGDGLYETWRGIVRAGDKVSRS